nr:DUF2459 domain-containing protein [Paracraurococcus ruber]
MSPFPRLSPRRAHANALGVTIAPALSRRKAAAAALGLLGGCAARPSHPCAAAAGADAWVVGHGWHTEIVLRRDDLAGPLAAFQAPFAGAAVLAFGFGKRSFVLAEAGAAEELLLGPLPGLGVVQVKGLRLPPDAVYPGRVIGLALPPGGLAPLCRFIGDSLRREAGAPVPAHPGALRGSLFYEAVPGYSLGFTCNTWTAAALRQAGLPVSEGGVVLAGAVLAQLAPLGCAA